MKELYKEEAMTAALVRELCSGRQFMESLQEARENDAASVAQDYRKQGKSRGGWKHLAEIPQHEYFTMMHKYGHEAWENREFVRDFQKHEPRMAGAYKA